MTLTFTVPGPPVSGNHYKQPGRLGGYYLPAGTQRYIARVGSLATAAVLSAGLRAPAFAWCRMDVVLWNVRIDRDNSLKVLNDALEGIVYPHDSRILDGAITKRKDQGGQRVEVRVTEVDPQEYGYKAEHEAGKSPSPRARLAPPGGTR